MISNCKLLPITKIATYNRYQRNHVDKEMVNCARDHERTNCSAKDPSKDIVRENLLILNTFFQNISSNFTSK